MLIVARKKDEWIHIGDDIAIVVHEIRGKTVRLGINAPATVKVGPRPRRKENLIEKFVKRHRKDHIGHGENDTLTPPAGAIEN